jgi:polyhydroxybutyrate depolymerase
MTDGWQVGAARANRVRLAFGTCRGLTAGVLVTTIIGCSAPGTSGIGSQGVDSTSPGSTASPSAAGTSGCAQQADDAASTVAVTIEGIEREAQVHVPARTDGGGPVPLIIAFHGYGGRGADQAARSGLSSLADQEGFVVVYPDALGDPAEWDLSGTSDVEFVEQLIAEIESALCIDPARIFATGFSMGGGMANVLGCRLAERIAAIAPVSGLYGATWGGDCHPVRPVPVLAFHGELDEAVPYGGGELTAFSEWAGRPAFAVEQWAAGWADRNGCDGDPEDRDPIGDVEPLVWIGCDAPVELYRITDGGHAWPGGVNDPNDGNATTAISANELMWTFFMENPLLPA